jgi:hypothetical protein
VLTTDYSIEPLDLVITLGLTIRALGNGKPVKIRRCPATVKGDEDPFTPLRNGKAGPRMNPKPGDRPSRTKPFVFRGEGEAGLSAWAFSFLNDCKAA